MDYVLAGLLLTTAGSLIANLLAYLERRQAAKDTASKTAADADSTNADVVDKYEKTAARMEQRYTELLKMYDGAQADLRLLRQDMYALQLSLKEKDATIMRLSSENATLTNQVTALTGRVRELEKQLSTQ